MERLDKIIAERLCVSRKDAKTLIKKGVVVLNGEIPKSTDLKCKETDVLSVHGVQLCLSKYIYIMLNKPSGVITATKDKVSQTVMDILPDNLRRKNLFPAGRLDKDTEGFVFITDDGVLAHNMLSPKNRIPKTYLAGLDSEIDLNTTAALFAKGIDIGEGEHTSPAELTLDSESGLYRLVIYEGMYHQVKRMFAKVGRKVVFLRREAIGTLKIDPALSLGESRLITADELGRIIPN